MLKNESLKAVGNLKIKGKNIENTGRREQKCDYGATGQKTCPFWPACSVRRFGR